MADKREDSRWEEIYRSQEIEELPWYFDGIDPDIAQALERYSITAGKALDLCTGPATQALALAERGFDVFATDIAATAISKGIAKARELGLPVAFKQADILRDDLGGEFDLLIDRGCFHVFEPRQRRQYVRTVSELLNPGGFLLLKCFSHKEKRRDGPYRFAPRQLEKYFSPAFEILSTTDSMFTGNRDHYPKALFSVMRKAA